MNESVSNESSAPSRPVIPSGVDERFVVANLAPMTTATLVYRPAVYAEASLHYVRSSANLDQWVDTKRIVLCARSVPEDLWQASGPFPLDAELADQPDEGFSFGELPTALLSSTNFRAFEKQFKDFAYRHLPLTLYRSPLLKVAAPGGCTEIEARNHFKQIARESLDRETEELRSKYAVKMKVLDGKIQSAQERVDRESQQYEQAKLSSAISFGASILGAFLGNKVASRTNVSKISTAARGAGRAAQQRGDVVRAEESLKQLAIEMQTLDAELKEELEKLGQRYRVEDWELETTSIPPRKSDLKVSAPMILWTPWQVDSSGIASPLY